MYIKLKKSQLSQVRHTWWGDEHKCNLYADTYVDGEGDKLTWMQLTYTGTHR